MSLGIKVGDVLTNKQITQLFHCSPQGGIRVSKSLHSIALLSNAATSYYNNQWKGNVLYFTGSGRWGDQKLLFSSNRTLAESNTNGYSLHLFEALNRGEFTYRGLATLAGEPFQDEQPDMFGKMRKVWIFPLKVEKK